MNQNRIKSNAKKRIKQLDKSKIEIDIDTLQVFYNQGERENGQPQILEITTWFETFTEDEKRKQFENLKDKGAKISNK